MKKIASYRFALLIIWLGLTAFNLLFTFSLVHKHVTTFQTLVLFFTSFITAIIVALIWLGSYDNEINNKP